MDKERQKTLDSLAARVNKEQGEEAIIVGRDIQHQVIPRITSGLLGLDLALGGGWPVNTWNEVFGEESSGKTATVMKTIAANQARDPDWVALWIAAEDFVPSYAEMIGVDLERLVIVDTNVMEFAYDVIIEYVEARAVDCVVIDSLPALVATAEGEDEMEKFHPGLNARLTGQFFRKVRKSGRRSLVIEDRPMTGFLINQYREKIGVSYGDSRTTPGGKAKNFACFTRVETRRDEWLENGLKGADKLRIGQSIKARTIKNKSAPGQRLAAFDFYFDEGGPVPAGGFDTIKDVFNVAIGESVVSRKGPYYYYGDAQWQGRAAAAEALRLDPDLVRAIREEVFAVQKQELREVVADE